MGLDIVGFASITTGEVKEFKLPPATNRSSGTEICHRRI